MRPVAEQEFSEACAADRELRTQVRKRGLTQPRCEVPAKRLRTGASISASAMACTDGAPSNMLDLRNVPPAKRLRVETSLDDVMSAWCKKDEQVTHRRSCSACV